MSNIPVISPKPSIQLSYRFIQEMYSVSLFRSHPSTAAACSPAAGAYVRAKLGEALPSSQNCFQGQYAVNCLLLLVSFNQEQEDQSQNHKTVALEWVL